MELLERDRDLGVLRECLGVARGRHGRLVLLGGEAGIGKTALVERFVSGLRGVRVALGACDPLATPRPLGPVLDIGDRLGLETEPADSDASRHGSSAVSWPSWGRGR